MAECADFAKFAEIANYLLNQFVCVMNDAIFRIEFPKSTRININLIAFGGVLNNTQCGESRHSNLSCLKKF